MSVTIRVPPETHERLLELAASRKQPIGQIVAEAVERLASDRFWEEMEAAFEQLYADPDSAADYEADRRGWDATLLDGLEKEPPYDDEAGT